MIRVATYNIHAGIGVDGRFDLERIAATLAALDADIVALQEVDVHWSERSGFTDGANELGAALGMGVFFAPVYDLPGGHRYGVATLSRKPFSTTVSHRLTRLPTYFEAYEKQELPGFADVTVDLDGTGLRVLNTHLDHRPDPALRALQVKQTMALVGATSTRTVLLGDLNAGPDAPELAPLWATFVDLMGDRTDAATFPSVRPTVRIDHIAATPDISATRTEVVDSTASDHRAVYADLEIG